MADDGVELTNINLKKRMDKHQFISEFSESLQRGHAAYFVGSGISVPSKLPNWEGLIKEFMEEIAIDNVSEHDDLPLLAQFYTNEHEKLSLCERINEDFTGKCINNYHKILQRTNVKTLWTTNYDDLLEQTFPASDTVVKVSDDDIFKYSKDEIGVEIIKMHGSIGPKHYDIVITQSDYEDFFVNRPATIQRLKLDLLQKSFLFIGYNYGDPNIQNIVTEARRISSKSETHKHYILLKNKLKKENNADIKFKLWLKNLERYNIFSVVYEEHSELEEILNEVSLKSRGNTVFITGSHQTDANSDIVELGRFLVKKQIIIIDGQSSGAMRIAINSFMNECIDLKIDYKNMIKYFSNPYAANKNFANDIKLLPSLQEFRVPLMKSTQFLVAFDGGLGTCAELELAVDMGCIIIPYFKDDTKETWSFIDKLRNVKPNYIEKIKNKKLTIEDLKNYLDKIIQ